jgi:hypothetical protein
MFCYLAALRNTSVADVAIIYGTAPFVTAIVALIVLGERTTPVTLWSSGLALVGVALMFAGSSISDVLDGDLLALGMTVLMALMIITTRRSESASSLPIAAISSLASSIVAAPLADFGRPSLLQFAELALFGVCQLGLGLLLLTAGTKLLSASRVALIGGLDVPLAPIGRTRSRVFQATCAGDSMHSTSPTSIAGGRQRSSRSRGSTKQPRESSARPGPRNNRCEVARWRAVLFETPAQSPTGPGRRRCCSAIRTAQREARPRPSDAGDVAGVL